MDQALGNPSPGINIVNSNITAKNDVHVTVNNPDSILKRLKSSLNPVTSASYDSYEAGQRSECFPDTRVQVLDNIKAWIRGESHQAPIYILDGVAGIGKSTVAQTIANWAAALGLLGASFFFSRDEDMRSVARHFFPTIAYQLSCYDGILATHVSHSLDKNPDAPAKLLHQQLSLLLLEPLQALLSQKRPTLIVVDALDECEERGAGELLNLLGQHIPRIQGLKILITSRPEAHLRHVLDEDGNHEKYCLHEIEDSIVHSDIRLYLQLRLSAEEIRKVARHRQTRWQPTDKDIKTLCGMCGTLFIIAATAIKFILDSRFHPQKQLSRLLDGVSVHDFSGSKYNNTLDHTYLRIICAALSGQIEIDIEWLRDLNRVLGALVTLANPLPYKDLASLLEMDPDDLESTLSQLHSLVAPTPNGANGTFRIHHKSFPDFITDKKRIQEVLVTWKSNICPGLDSILWINVIDHHLQLAKACFKTMDRSLKRNMGNIQKEDWYKDKENIPYLNPRLIPRELAYAALHWASHLLASGKLNKDSELQAYLDDWASRHILSWIETITILDQVNDIYGILQDVIKSLKCSANSSWAKQTRVLDLISDVCRSCLPFAPIETSFYDNYSGMLTSRVELGKSYQWNPLVATLIGHLRGVASIAFSSDGSRLASGSNDKTVRLWDASTGAHLSTLTGHSHWVISVAFSSDGSRLASGSIDDTVRLWDASTGTYLSTLTGHTGSVNSVAFSSNGSRLASGSDDSTVRLWNASTGEHLSTLTDHSHNVTSVAFSSNSSQLASGSYDKTVRLWDASTGECLSTLSLTSSVTSVAFSSNGSRLATGSNDKTVRLWDASTGAQLSTLTGHLYDVTSVAFSIDGSRLASGSMDQTVRLWDASTGAHLSTLAGHCNLVNSVTFSCDGNRLASGSYNSTIRLWDVSTAAHLSTLNLNGHSDPVTSIAFSRDGSRLASGSNDKTVLLWDASTGALLSTLNGHLGVAVSVTFSSDGSQLASGSGETVQLWNASTGARLSTLTVTSHLSSVTSVAFSSDGSRLAFGCYDRTVRLWDASMVTHLFTLTGHSREIKSVAFSRDGSQLASGSCDSTVRLWDTSTGAHLSTLSGHSDWVNAVAFSSDGSLLASGSDDSTVRLWGTNTGAHLSTLEGHSFSINSIMSLLFLPNSLQMTFGSRPLLCWNGDSISLLLLVKRVNPLVSGIIMANLVQEGHDIRWEVIPVCWFPPDIQATCFSINPLNSWLAIGCEDGRVMVLNFFSHYPNDHD